MGPADFALLDAWAAGDGASARVLIDRHTGSLVRYFERKVTVPVDDLVQDTLLACVEGRSRFRRDAGFRSYLLGIARNVLFAHLRARRHEHDDLDAESNYAQDLGPTPIDVVARKKEGRLLLTALRHLPVQTQVLLELYHWQGMRGPELAALYRVCERTMRSRLSRAKGQLRSRVARLAMTPGLMHPTWPDFEGWASSLPKMHVGETAA